MTGDVAALDVSKTAVLDGLEHLRLGTKDCVLRFRNVAVDPYREPWIFFLIEPARPLEFSLAFYDPGVGGLLAVEALRFAMDDSAAFFNDDLGGKSL